MSHGPSRYDPELTAARESAQAEGAVLIVFGGNRGSGFAVQVPGELLHKLPALLENMAAQIREDLRPKGSA